MSRRAVIEPPRGIVLSGPSAKRTASTVPANPTQRAGAAGKKTVEEGWIVLVVTVAVGRLPLALAVSAGMWRAGQALR
eukprot:3000935-Rhodomonas_salina.2